MYLSLQLNTVADPIDLTLTKRKVPISFYIVGQVVSVLNNVRLGKILK